MLIFYFDSVIEGTGNLTVGRNLLRLLLLIKFIMLTGGRDTARIFNLLLHPGFKYLANSVGLKLAQYQYSCTDGRSDKVSRPTCAGSREPGAPGLVHHSNSWTWAISAVRDRGRAGSYRHQKWVITGGGSQDFKNNNNQKIIWRESCVNWWLCLVINVTCDGGSRGPLLRSIIGCKMYWWACSGGSLGVGGYRFNLTLTLFSTFICVWN